VHLAHGTVVPAADAARRSREVRPRYGIEPDTVVFGCFGGLTPEKRVAPILAAFDAIRHRLPPSVLLLGGEAPSYYDLRGDIARYDLDRLVRVTGYVDDEDDLTSLIAASDITLNLRWPTARELSGPWLRSLAAGRCSIVSALPHLAGIPLISAGSWTPAAPASIAVAVDLAEEADQLPKAMTRLATDRPLREQIGSDARAYWQREHSYDLMVEDYRRLLPLAASLPTPRPRQPRHLINDGSALAAQLLAPLGVPLPWSSM
jgi:glycosyltransferase involved in cell wall biosynthesis